MIIAIYYNYVQKDMEDIIPKLSECVIDEINNLIRLDDVCEMANSFVTEMKISPGYIQPLIGEIYKFHVTIAEIPPESVLFSKGMINKFLEQVSIYIKQAKL